MTKKRLPDAEFAIMDFIWDREPPVTTTMVHTEFGDKKGWKLQTIVSYFGRLVERGFLRAENSGGKSRNFYPLISKEEYLEMETQNFMRQYNFKSPASLISTLSYGKNLSEEDLDELEQLIRETRKRNGRR
ncbi:MAG: BlaI/MecI/CopY family transcriptional regulator [Eubacteriales bacterium]|nr:BlaI/MecI/CopY family transcriptional regulator [Eubacteriales bacterium]